MSIIGAFTTEHAARLAGLSKRQLGYWDAENVFHPSLSRGKKHQPYGKIYSFQDIVALRTLAQLRQRFSLQKLRVLGDSLKERYDHPWSQIRFYVAGDEIVFADPATGKYISTKPQNQSILEIELEPIACEAESALQADIRRRKPASIGRIDRHRYVARNEWVVGGTRIPVWIIQDLHRANYDEHMPTSAYEFLKDRGHDTHRVRDELPLRTEDPAIVAHAHQLKAVILTINRKHFKPLVTRDPNRNTQEFPDAGLISMKCRADAIVLLMTKHIRDIEAIHAVRQNDDDPRVIAEIDHNGIKFY